MDTNETKTLRDEFAMAALTGLLSIPDTYKAASNEPEADKWIARGAYELADAMMAQRKK
jgi:hypothetical protein